MDDLFSHFNPIQVELKEPTLDAVAAALPEAAQRIRGSRCPQEPIVIITEDSPANFSTVAELFIPEEYGADAEGAFHVTAGHEMGEVIVDHINEGWMGIFDETGRNIEWKPDYQPQPFVIAFMAQSARHAYLRTVMAIADGGDWEDVAGLSRAFEYQREMDRFIDLEAEMLFLHYTSAQQILSIALVKMRDVVNDAKQFLMGPTPEQFVEDILNELDAENKPDVEAGLPPEGALRELDADALQIDDLPAFNRLTEAMMNVGMQLLQNPSLLETDAPFDAVPIRAWEMADGRAILHIQSPGQPTPEMIEIPAGAWKALTPEQSRDIESHLAFRDAMNPQAKMELMSRIRSELHRTSQSPMGLSAKEQIILIADRSPESLSKLNSREATDTAYAEAIRQWEGSEDQYLVISAGTQSEHFWVMPVRNLQELLHETLPEIATSLGEGTRNVSIHPELLRSIAAQEIRSVWKSLGGAV